MEFDREMGAWDPNLPNICSKGDISDADLIASYIPLGSFPLVRTRRAPEQCGVGDGTVSDGIFGSLAGWAVPVSFRPSTRKSTFRVVFWILLAAAGWFPRPW